MNSLRDDSLRRDADKVRVPSVARASEASPSFRNKHFATDHTKVASGTRLECLVDPRPHAHFA